MAMIGTIPLEKEQYKAKNFVINSSKLRLHQRRREQGPQVDPRHLPNFTPEEQNAAREHADSLVFGSTLEQVRVATKAAPPSTRAESLAPGPLEGEGEVGSNPPCSKL